MLMVMQKLLDGDWINMDVEIVFRNAISGGSGSLENSQRASEAMSSCEEHARSPFPPKGTVGAGVAGRPASDLARRA